METGCQQIISTVYKIHHNSIIKDIQGDVIMDLYYRRILTEDEYLDIKSEKIPEKEASRLLELLPLKGSYGLSQFLNYLSAHYPWLAELIQSSITCEYNNGCLTNLQHALTIGEVPQLFSKHVSRNKLVITLSNFLKNLEAGQFVVVHGMTGCGKSSLVIEVLNDPLITMHYFQEIVQWIHVGRENSNVECIQTELINRLNNQESHISIPLNKDYETTRRELQDLWKKKQLTCGLLILDDVCSNEIVKYLDIGCKILITTHDRSIMDDVIDTRINYVKVNEGFEEKETLDLFSKCLNVSYLSLPRYASMLHKICKGFPLTISLIGTQLEMHKEEAINNNHRWKFYLEELSTKISDPFKFTPRSHNQLQRLEKAIKMCIECLPNDLQKKYLDFSLFVRDVNIKPEVLSILWGLKKTQVEDIMLELIHKSLVVRIWNQPLNSYVYSIHDLLLTNLKKMKNDVKSKELHKKLIESYRAYCKGNFADLPKNDNYIFLYFGYHLKNANMLQEFPLWFLNLKFLESKICVTGPADLLADFKKYRKYIAVENYQKKYITDIEEFVKCIGSNLYQTKCDIIQLGLLESETSFVYNQAYNIAKSCQKPFFYYNVPAPENCLPKPYISIVRDKIETVIFGNNFDEVLIATESGSIKVWNIISHKCLYTYIGHTKRVTHMVKNKSKDRFLSTSDDSTIRIWKMKNFPLSDGDFETLTPSPETKQEHWQDLFSTNNYESPTDNTDCILTLDSHTGPVIFAQFSSDGRLVVSTSTDKKIKIWKLEDFDKDGNLKVLKTITHTSVIKKCYFMENKPYDNLLYLTHSHDGSTIHGGQFPFEHFPGLLYLNEKVLSFFPLPSFDENVKVLIMTPNKVKCYYFNWNTFERINECFKPVNKQHYKSFSISEELSNETDNSRYFAFSLSNCTIQICNSWTGYNYLDLNNPAHDILNLDWFRCKKDQSNWLLCAAEDKSIRVWCIKNITQYTCAYQAIVSHQPNGEFENVYKNEIISLQSYKLISEKQNVYCCKLKQSFDAVWLNNNSSLLVAAVTQCGMLKIIFEGLEQWSIIDKKVSALSIVHADKKEENTMVLVACDDLSLNSLKIQTSKCLFKTIDLVDQIFTFYDGDYLIIATLSKSSLKENMTDNNQGFEIWTNKGMRIQTKVTKFIDCFVFRDKIILLQRTNEIRVLIIKDSSYVDKTLEIECALTDAKLMLDHSTFVIAHMSSCLRIYKLIYLSSSTLGQINKIDQYDLPFNINELISISVSNNKHFIIIGGQKNIVFIDIISKEIKYFIADPNMKIIQSIVWSSDDTRFVIKEVNQIMLFDVKFDKKIASVSLTADRLVVDPFLKKYIAINTAGKLVIFNLL